MIFGILIDLIVGTACIAFGLLIWKKQKISLLHDYHYRNVKQEDLPAFSRQMGIGLILVGTGIFVTGLLESAYSSFWWVPLTAGLFLGLTVIFQALNRFNRTKQSNPGQDSRHERS